MMVALIYDLAGEVAENTLYFNRSFALDPETLEAAATGMMDWWFNNLADWQSADTFLTDCIAVDLTTSSSYVASVSPTTVTGGNNSGVGMPNNVSACISFRTPFRGRSFRGRNYTLGLTEAFKETPNTMTPDYMAGITAAYSLLLTVPPEETLTWVVVSRFSGGLPRAEGVATPITSVGFRDNVFDSQRRRLPGRGS
jgi:hypothetical protein